MTNKRYRKQDVVRFTSHIHSNPENETTLSYYNHEDYEKFKADPEEKWM